MALGRAWEGWVEAGTVPAGIARVAEENVVCFMGVRAVAGLARDCSNAVSFFCSHVAGGVFG